jgi:predicted RNA binding protein YcfA (HicA-like mRNA interferase family)
MDTYPLNAHHPSEWNRYGYVANNPVNAVDPSGLNLNAYGLRQQTVTLPTAPTFKVTGEGVAVTFLVLGIIILAISGKDAVDTLEKLGCTLVRISGSHHIVRCPGGCQASIPVHGNQDIPKGTLGNIRRQLRPCIPDINKHLQ